jgi:Arc/MetJ family transcription regulator
MAEPQALATRERKSGFDFLTSRELNVVASNSASNDAMLCAQEDSMRTTVSLDDELVADAQSYTGLTEKSALLREALTALIQRESARRLARLGGSEPDAEYIPRRRPTA